MKCFWTFSSLAIWDLRLGDQTNEAYSRIGRTRLVKHFLYVSMLGIVIERRMRLETKEAFLQIESICIEKLSGGEILTPRSPIVLPLETEFIILWSILKGKECRPVEKWEDLDWESLRFQVLDQLEIESRSLWAQRNRDREVFGSDLIGILKVILTSSANNQIEEFGEENGISGRSLIKIVKRRGPKIDPWGTPLVHGKGRDRLFL